MADTCTRRGTAAQDKLLRTWNLLLLRLHDVEKGSKGISLGIRQARRQTHFAICVCITQCFACSLERFILFPPF